MLARMWSSRNVNSTTIWQNVWFHIVKHSLSVWPSHFTFGTYLREMKTHAQSKTIKPIPGCSQHLAMHYSQRLKTTRVSLNRRISKPWSVQTKEHTADTLSGMGKSRRNGAEPNTRSTRYMAPFTLSSTTGNANAQWKKPEHKLLGR